MELGSRTLLDRGLGGERGGEYLVRESMVEWRDGTERERALLSRTDVMCSARRMAVGCRFTLLVL